jgi:hypothetical protein
MVKKKGQSNRKSLKQKYKIEKKVKVHQSKLRKEARRNPKPLFKTKVRMRHFISVLLAIKVTDCALFVISPRTLAFPTRGPSKSPSFGKLRKPRCEIAAHAR